jgi:anti-sigma factor RsiW
MPLTCKEFIELVTHYLEGALPAAERSRFEAHLEGCHGCEVYLDQLRQTIHLTGALAEESIPRQAQVDLLRAFQDWKQGG